MCLKCVQWLINVLFKSSIIMLCHQIMKNTYKWRTRKFEMFLFTICEVASHFSSVRKFWVVKCTVPYVECLNISFVRIRQAVSERSRWEHERFLQSQSDWTAVYLSPAMPNRLGNNFKAMPIHKTSCVTLSYNHCQICCLIYHCWAIHAY